MSVRLSQNILWEHKTSVWSKGNRNVCSLLLYITAHMTWKLNSIRLQKCVPWHRARWWFNFLLTHNLTLITTYKLQVKTIHAHRASAIIYQTCYYVFKLCNKSNREGSVQSIEAMCLWLDGRWEVLQHTHEGSLGCGEMEGLLTWEGSAGVVGGFWGAQDCIGACVI